MTSASTDPPEEVSGDVLVLFHFQDIPIPRSTLGKVDWYLSGAVSRVTVDGKFTGALGTAALFHPAGKFQVEKILVVGLGPRAQVDPPAVRAAVQHLRSTVDHLYARDIRVVLPDLPHISPREAIDLFSATLQTPGEGRADGSTFTFLTYENEDRL